MSYRGAWGIDSIYKSKDGKTIYIIESKASGVKEGCKAGGLCSTKDGKQGSRGWINRDRLEAAGLDDAERTQVLRGLEGEGDVRVVRLYAGTNARGETRFYEIRDKNGSRTDVVVDRAGKEYQFP